MSNLRAALDRLFDLSDPMDPVDEQAIEQFEAELGARLPGDFREFLLVQNGGRLHIHTSFEGHDKTQFEWAGKTNSDLAIEFLYGLGEEQGTNELRSMRETFRGRIPDDWLMFGEGATYHHYCLSLGPDDYGMVWLWNRDGESEPTDMAENLKLATPQNCTFEEFLGQLKVNEYALELAARDAQNSPEPMRSILMYDLAGLKRHLAAGGLADCRDKYDRTPLIIAARKWPNVVPLLLQHGAEIEARDAWGQAPLYYASSSSIDSVRTLLRYGADPLAENYEKVTPLIRAAIRARFHSMPRFLEAMRAQLEARGIAVDYRLVEKIARAEYCTAIGEGKDNDRFLAPLAFFGNGKGIAYLSGSGIILVFGEHSQEEIDRGVFTSSLAELIELIPKAWACSPSGPLPRARYEICDRLFAQAAKGIVPQQEGPTRGDFVGCLGKLYQEIVELTAQCTTHEQALQAVSSKEPELIAELAAALQQVCSARNIPEEPSKGNGQF